MKAKLREEDWREIGVQAKIARDQLFTLHQLSRNRMPARIVRYLDRAIDSLDNYRSKAEDMMLAEGASDDLFIFYGELIREDKDNE